MCFNLYWTGHLIFYETYTQTQHREMDSFSFPFFFFFGRGSRCISSLDWHAERVVCACRLPEDTPESRQETSTCLCYITWRGFYCHRFPYNWHHASLLRSLLQRRYWGIHVSAQGYLFNWCFYRLFKQWFPCCLLWDIKMKSSFFFFKEKSLTADASSVNL